MVQITDSSKVHIRIVRGIPPHGFHSFEYISRLIAGSSCLPKITLGSKIFRVFKTLVFRHLTIGALLIVSVIHIWFRSTNVGKNQI